MLDALNRSRFTLVVQDIVRRVEEGSDTRLKTVDYFNHATIANFPQPRQTIKEAIRLVKAAKRTGNLDTLRNLLGD